MIYVVAPTHRQAVFWLGEFGTNPHSPEVVIIPLPRWNDKTDDPHGTVPAVVRGYRWDPETDDEFLVVGNPDDIDTRDFTMVTSYLNIPDDIVSRELEAASPIV